MKATVSVGRAAHPKNVERHMRTPTRVLLGCGLLLAVTVLPIGTCYVVDKIKNSRPDVILENAGLAPLPASAENVRTHFWKGFLGTFMQYLKFTASQEDIDDFIDRSPSLRAVTAEVFNKDRMYLPWDARDALPLEESLKHQYFQPRGPDWFDPSVRTKGRAYGHRSGLPRHLLRVIVDDASGTVYVERGD